MAHHCVVYLRIFHESLSVSSIRSDRRLAIVNTLERSCVAAPLQDNYSFRLIPWNDLSRQLQVTKCREQGENDLHLSVPGLWPSTLYPEIFGVSENWLVLLSQVIRLSNEKEHLETSQESAGLSVKDFMKSAKALEVCILRLDGTFTDDGNMATFNLLNDGVDSLVLDDMSAALRNALAIYFYRRIYDVDPEVLKPLVMKVRDSLSACKLTYDTIRRYLHGLLWSAFIAGCEALDVEVQNFFTEWLDSEHVQQCNSISSRLRDIMQKTWNQRENGGTRSISWLDLLRHEQTRS